MGWYDNSWIPFSFSGAHLKTIPRQEEGFAVTSPNLGTKVGTNGNATEDQAARQHTAFGKALYDLTHSEKVMNDLIFGRRVGLYELRGQIGSGNFSQVRLGIHDLTKGEILDTLSLFLFKLHFHGLVENDCRFKITVITSHVYIRNDPYYIRLYFLDTINNFMLIKSEKAHEPCSLTLM